jgi:MFS family permease
MFLFSNYLIQRYGSQATLVTAQVTTCVRFGIYLLSTTLTSHADALILILCSQLLHGLSFALYWSAIVFKTSALFDASNLNLSLASINVLYFTIGGMIGNILWGWVYDYMGIFYVYTSAFFLCCLSTKSLSYIFK